MTILHWGIFESVWGRPVHCSVRQSVTMFDKKMSGVGSYVRSGNGEGKLRFSLRFSAHDHLNTITQVCDGARLLTIEDIGAHKKQTEVDLGKIRAPLGLTSQTVYDPLNSLYLAIGGQAEVFRELCQRYHWESVQKSTHDGQPVWVLSGTFSDKPKSVRGMAPVDVAMIGASLTGLAPTRVEIVIATQEASVPYWLYERKLAKPAGNPESGAQATKIDATTQWHGPQRLTDETLDPNLFFIPDAGGGRFADETARYMPPKKLIAASPAAIR